MRASHELLLLQIYCSVGSFISGMRVSGLTSVECWADQRGLLKHLHRLEAEAFLEALPGGNADRIYKLTPKGAIAAMGGKDPCANWNQPWDGLWRLVVFDMPQERRAERLLLHRALREHGLGRLQGSVWISPRPLEDLREQLAGDRHPSSLLLLEGQAIGAEKPSEIVREAWNFGEICDEWLAYRTCLRKGKRLLRANPIDSSALKEWAKLEHHAWQKIIRIDPFLPKALLPREYCGKKIWQQRLKVWKAISKTTQLPEKTSRINLKFGYNPNI